MPRAGFQQELLHAGGVESFMRNLRLAIVLATLCAAVATALATAPAAEQERNDAIEARDRADLARSDYERAYKSGAPPKEGRESFDHVVALYEKAIDRPLSSPEIIEVVGYCYIRLAGAYQYTGQFDKAIEVAKKGVDATAGTAQEVSARHAVGLIYLQAKHDTKEALVWFKKARELAATAFKDPQEQSKWIAATDEGIDRSEREARN